MLMLALTAISPAKSYTIAGDMMCESAYLTDTLPAHGQVGVPLDTSLIMVVAGDCGETRFRVVLEEKQSGNVVHDEEVYASLGWESMTPGSPLRPETAYILSFVPQDGWGSPTTIEFETGGDMAAGMRNEAPQLTIDSADVWREGSSWYRTSVGLTMVPVEDPDHLSVIEVHGVGHYSYSVHAIDMDGSEAINHWLMWDSSEPPSEVCFEVIQYDTLGHSASSEVSCMETNFEGWTGWQRWGGCSTAGGMAGAFAMLPGLVALLRRRR